MFNRVNFMAAVLACVASPCIATADKPQTALQVHVVSDLVPAAASTPPLELASALGQRLGVEVIALGPGLVAVSATNDDQRTFSSALDSLRAAYAERVGVRLAVYEIRSEAPPRAGAQASPEWGRPIQEDSRIVHRRLPTPIQLVTQRTFVADVDVVVGGGGMGFEPEIGEVAEGLDATINVGPARDRRSLVRLNGELKDAALRSATFKGHIGGALSGAVGESSAPVELPKAVRRSLNGVVSVPDEQETVISAMNSAEPGGRIVITVTLTPVK